MSVNVAQYFTDPAGDTLTYSATSSNAGVATGSVAGSTVTLTPVGVGTATITVTARDPGGLTATQSIAVTVASGPSSDDHGNMPATATFIGANSSTDGTLEQGGDVDYFRFVVSARTTLTVESTGNTDTVGRLEASDGSVLASNDDGGSGSNFRIREEVSAGTYYIQVRGYSPDDAGPYTLVVSSAGTPSEIPDLVVESPAVSSGAVAPDEPFTLSATVRNQGAGAAGSTTLRYYRSSNTRISTSDTAVGTDGVPALAGNRTSSLSTSLRAPNSAGTYYYGACVDAVGGESDTGNNCSTGVRVVVSPPPVNPSLNCSTGAHNYYHSWSSGLSVAWTVGFASLCSMKVYVRAILIQRGRAVDSSETTVVLELDNVTYYSWLCPAPGTDNDCYLYAVYPQNEGYELKFNWQACRYGDLPLGQSHEPCWPDWPEP